MTLSRTPAYPIWRAPVRLGLGHASAIRFAGSAICVLMLSAAVWAPGTAQATSTVYDQCMDKAGGVTSSMRDCSAAEDERQDKELNSLYKQAMSRRDAVGRARLRDEERDWLKRRKAECVAILNEEDGTAGLLDSDDCWIQLTDKRIAQLRALANGKP